uniref:Uncharacterized protein n=1 Tax=Panagrolaimus sp. JU765 TaxID=591449 RepID=A0AC34PYW9_9BILA
MNVKTRIFFSVIIFFLSIDSSLSETKAFAQGNLAV